jgi:hypothetical protein
MHAGAAIAAAIAIAIMLIVAARMGIALQALA